MGRVGRETVTRARPWSCETCAHVRHPAPREPHGAPAGRWCDFEGEMVTCPPSGVCGRWVDAKEEEHE